MEAIIVKRQKPKDWVSTFQTTLDSHESVRRSNPQHNPVWSLAYDISKAIDSRELAFRDIEAIVKMLSDEEAIARARRLRQRAGLDRLEALTQQWNDIATSKAAKGFEAFKNWLENAGQSIVFTAHPTFSLSEDIYNLLGEVASKKDGQFEDQIEHLKTLPYRQKSPPTLQEEHGYTQNALRRIQTGLDKLNHNILDFARSQFPDQWTELTPCLFKIYSWVGYDIDGRTDIDWSDAILSLIHI